MRVKVSIFCFFTYLSIQQAIGQQAVGDKCDPQSIDIYPSSDPQTYLFCALSGRLREWRCPGNQVFDRVGKQCADKVSDDSTNSTTTTTTSTLSITATQPAGNGSARQFQGLCQGGTPFISTLTGLPQTCNILTSSQCPPNFFCQPQPAATTSYCCSIPLPPSGSPCPAGSQVVNFAGTTRPMTCNLFGSTTCPLNARCQASAPGSTQGVCCTGVSSPTTGGCPAGTTLVPGVTQIPGVGSAQQCGLNMPTCPTGAGCFQLQTFTTASTAVCCRSSSSSPIFACASGHDEVRVFRTFAMDPNGQPITCSSSVSCPFSYQCQFDPMSQRSYCCSGATAIDTELCPIGFFATTQVTGQPTICAGTGQGTCPAGGQCIFNPNQQRSICCTSRTSPNSQPACPIGMQWLVDPSTQQPAFCTGLGQGSCPPSYQCMMSTMLQRNTCCAPLGPQSGNFVCMNGPTPSIDPQTGAPRVCNPSSPSCPIGFVCVAQTQSTQCQPGYLLVAGQCKRLQCTLVDN